MLYRDGEKGYPWFSFRVGGAWVAGLLVVLLLAGLGTAAYLGYSRISSDLAPDSLVGLGFAVAGTFFLLLAAVGFTTHRRSQKRAVGHLNVVLNWHVWFAIIGFVMLFLHSFGNFNPRSGTYALYGMAAMVISGFIGRFLDRVVPRMITGEVKKALTAQGEDRIETISQKLQSIVVHNTQELRAFKASGPRSLPGILLAATKKESAGPRSLAGAAPDTSRKVNQVLQTPWDLAYISLEETPQELNRDAAHYRFVPDKKSALAQPGALLPGAREHYTELQYVQHALQREQFLRHIIRYWRVFHISLAMLTVALTLWHIEFALSLMIPTFLHH